MKTITRRRQAATASLAEDVQAILEVTGFTPGSTRANGFLVRETFPSESTAPGAAVHYLDWENDTDHHAAARAADKAVREWAFPLRATGLTVTETWRCGLRTGLIITREAQ